MIVSKLLIDVVVFTLPRNVMKSCLHVCQTGGHIQNCYEYPDVITMQDITAPSSHATKVVKLHTGVSDL